MLTLLLCLHAVAQDAPAPAASSPPDAPAAELPPLVKNPELVRFVQAPFPEQARADGVEGNVLLLLDIDEAGKVTQVAVLTAAGHGFDEAAVEAARQFEFSPAADANGPVPVQIEFEYGFVLDAAAHPEAIPDAAASAETPVAEVPINLDGTVVEMGTRRPLAGFVVRAEPVGVETTTDDAGYYAFRGLPPGPAVLKVVHPGYDAMEKPVEVVADARTNVRLWLRNVNYSDPGIVGAYRKETADVTRHTISIEEVRRVPGTFGDPVRVVQSLPGAARAPFGTGLLIIRGSEPADSGVYVDGIRIPYIYHLGGIESVINPDLVQSVDYLPGGFGVQYGRGLGGIVDVTLREEMPERVQVRWNTDAIDTSVMAMGSLGKKDQHGFGVAARASYINLLLPLFVQDGFTISPSWWDYQARYIWQGGGKSRFSVTVFGFRDELVASTPEGFSQGTDADVNGDFGTVYSTHRIAALWETEISPTVNFRLAPAFGNDYADVIVGDSLRLEQSQWLAEVRAEVGWQPTDHVRVAGGTDFLGGWSTFDVQFPFNPADFASTDPLGEREPWGFSDLQTGLGPDPYVYADFRPLADLDALKLVAGLRWMIYSIPDEITTMALDPRLTARWRFLPKSWVKASAGLYHQPPQPFQSYRSDDLPVELSSEEAWSATLGVEQDIGQAVHIEVEGFYKWLDQLIVGNPDFVSLDDQYFVNDGIGRVYGVEAIVRHDPIGRFFGWISYTLSRSERQDHPGEDWYPYDFDQTHNLVAVAGYNLPWDFNVSARVQYTTGNPTTPYELGVYDIDQDSYMGFQSGAYNSERLPPYWTVSARIDKLFTFKSWQLSLFVDVINALHGENPEFEIYNYDYTEKAYVTGLPIIPSPGFEVRFEL